MDFLRVVCRPGSVPLRTERQQSPTEPPYTNPWLMHLSFHCFYKKNATWKTWMKAPTDYTESRPYPKGRVNEGNPKPLQNG
jgi:hypothetical protein